MVNVTQSIATTFDMKGKIEQLIQNLYFSFQ